MARINWSQYTDEILSMRDENMSSSQIAEALSKRHGGKFDDRAIRRVMSKRNTLSKITEDAGFSNPDGWKHGWLKTKEGTVFIHNAENTISFEDMRDEFLEELKKYSPKFEKIKRQKTKDPHLLVVDIADLHIGKLAVDSESGDPYNVETAIQRGLDGVKGILEKANGFPIEQIVFVIGNDVLHTDNGYTTTKGTRQDTDGSWYENYKQARTLYAKCIELLLTVADVHVCHNPSNHDYVSGYMLADAIYCYFKDCKNVTFDITNANRKYYKYGVNMIATAHGDGAKMEDLPLIMANESKHIWAETEFRYIYLHHIHHFKKFIMNLGKDYHGIVMEYLRSPSGTDSWHHLKGFQHAPKGINGFVHHKKFGQVARLTHLFS